MNIKRMTIKNFKSIEDAVIDFTPFTTFVGANAAGKSNLINVFRFIQNILTDGIDNAIALQGGVQYLANANLPKGEKIEISFVLDLRNETWIRHLRNKKFALEVEEIESHFIIQPNRRGGGYHIAYDFIKVLYECYSFDSSSKEEKFKSLNTFYTAIYERKSKQSSAKFDTKIQFDGESANEELLKLLQNEQASDFFKMVVNEDKEELMLYRLSLLLPPAFSENTFIRIFDFDPKELKKSSSMASTKIFSENGSNLASILQAILRNKEQTQRLTVLLNQFLPFIETVSVENNPDKSFSYKIRERYNKKSFHANFLSDGTVSILALIIALYFEEFSGIIILEEPERNIHPKLLAGLISSVEDVSKEKQVIITTHNPEFLKHTPVEVVKLVSRDDAGRTKVTAPIENKVVAAFLKNDLGLDDLFLQGLLED